MHRNEYNYNILLVTQSKGACIYMTKIWLHSVPYLAAFIHSAKAGLSIMMSAR